MLNKFQCFTKLELAIFITKWINVQIIKRGCAQQEDFVILEELEPFSVHSTIYHLPFLWNYLPPSKTILLTPIELDIATANQWNNVILSFISNKIFFSLFMVRLPKVQPALSQNDQHLPSNNIHFLHKALKSSTSDWKMASYSL